MMNFNNFLVAISLFMAFGLTSNSAKSYKLDGPIKFPEGFFCDVICEKWGILTGNTIMCFISHQGEYERFVARNPAYGVWRFYKVDITSDVGPLCQHALAGDEFFLNETDTACSMPQPFKKRYYSPHKTHSIYRFEEPTNQYDDYNPAVRSDVDTRVPMDAICELATSQICRLGKLVNCMDDKCCYKNVTSSSCHEENMSKFSDCYKVLFNVMNNTLYYE